MRILLSKAALFNLTMGRSHRFSECTPEMIRRAHRRADAAARASPVRASGDKVDSILFPDWRGDPPLRRSPRDAGYRARAARRRAPANRKPLQIGYIRFACFLWKANRETSRFAGTGGFAPNPAQRRSTGRKARSSRPCLTLSQIRSVRMGQTCRSTL